MAVLSRRAKWKNKNKNVSKTKFPGDYGCGISKSD
jgi:hypothetical protein